MRSKPTFLTIFLSFVTASLMTAQPFWTQTNGPLGGKINCLQAHPATGVLHTGTHGSGMYYFHAGSKRWIQSPIDADVVFSMLFTDAQSGMLLGLNNGMVLRTTNGNAWTTITVSNSVINSLVKNNAGIIFAGTDFRGVYRSTDMGMTWTQCNIGLSDSTIRSLVANVAGDVYAATSSMGVFRTTNNGASWFPSNNGLTNLSTKAITYGPSTVLFTGTSAGIYKSYDNGVLWGAAGLQSEFITSLAATAGGDLFAGTMSKKLYRSSDDGSTWSQTNFKYGLPTVIAPEQGTIISVGSDGNGVYQTTDNGFTWTSTNEGLINSNISSLAMHRPTQTIYAASNIHPAIYRTTDDGGTWSEVGSGITDNSVGAVCIDNAGNMYAGTGSRIWKLPVGNSQWMPLTGVACPVVHMFIDTSAGDLFAGTFQQGVYRSVNQGTTWGQISNGLPMTGYTTGILRSNNGTLYSSHSPGGVYASTNNGTNWQSMNAGLGNTDVHELAYDAAAGALYAGTSNGVWKSMDGGATWSSSNTGLTNAYILSVSVHQQSGHIMAGTYAGPFQSSDGGLTWAKRINGFIANAVKALITKYNGRVFAATDGKGVYKSNYLIPVELASFAATVVGNEVHLKWSTLSETVNHGFEIERRTSKNDWTRVGFIPGSGTSMSRHDYSFVDRPNNQGVFTYRLRQIDFDGSENFSHEITAVIQRTDIAVAPLLVFPHPANEDATVILTSDREEFVTLRLFDAVGREMQTLFSGELPAGSTSMRIDTRALTPGTYILRRSDANGVSALRMIIR